MTPLKQKLPLLLISFFLVTVFMVFMVLLFMRLNNPIPKPKPQIINTLSNNLSTIVPGKSTASDVKKILGEPSSLSSDGGKTFFYYNDSQGYIVNTVFLENGIVVFLEKDVSGKYDYYTNQYGKPELVVYGEDASVPWYVFLKQGVAFQQNENDINFVLYFSATSEVDFMKNVGSELNLSKTLPEANVETLF